MSTRAEITEAHFAPTAEGEITLRLTLLGNTTTLHMTRKVAAIGLGELILALTPPAPVTINYPPSTLIPE